jgi:hypothetical protein
MWRSEAFAPAPFFRGFTEVAIRDAAIHPFIE